MAGEARGLEIAELATSGKAILPSPRACLLTCYRGALPSACCESRQETKLWDGSHPAEKLGESILISQTRCLLLCLASARESPKKAEWPVISEQGRWAPQASSSLGRGGLASPGPGRLPVFCWARRPSGY